MAEKDKRMSLRAPLILGAVGFAVCGVAFLAFGLYILWDSSRLINFLAAHRHGRFLYRSRDRSLRWQCVRGRMGGSKDMKHPWIKLDGWRCPRCCLRPAAWEVRWPTQSRSRAAIIGFCWNSVIALGERHGNNDLPTPTRQMLYPPQIAGCGRRNLYVAGYTANSAASFG